MPLLRREPRRNVSREGRICGLQHVLPSATRSMLLDSELNSSHFTTPAEAIVKHLGTHSFCDTVGSRSLDRNGTKFMPRVLNVPRLSVICFLVLSLHSTLVPPLSSMAASST